jgi:hypothetical protein
MSETESQAVKAATCGNCDGDVRQTSPGVDSMSDGIVSREVRCVDCRARGTVAITSDGTAFSGYADGSAYPEGSSDEDDDSDEDEQSADDEDSEDDEFLFGEDR